MRVNRNEFLNVLESIQAGLTTKDVIEQSSCFAFHKGWVYTFNDEISCRRKSPLKLSGAVQAGPLLAILRKLPEDEVDVLTEDGFLVIKGKGRRSRVRMQEDVVLPFDKVEIPDEWKTLHTDFQDAVYVANQCVGKDESQYQTTCIHITKKYIEACDNHQAVRYKIKTPISEDFLVRGASIKHIISLDMTEFCESDSWIHFRNPTGLIYSCRRDLQEYEPLDDLLDLEGEEVTLPKGLIDASSRAETFSAENADNNEVMIKIEDDRLTIEGIGVSGDHKEIKKVKYQGPMIAFTVGPKLLVELVKRYNDCILSPERLKVDTGKFQYIVALGDPEEMKAKPKKGKKNEDSETEDGEKD